MGTNSLLSGRWARRALVLVLVGTGLTAVIGQDQKPDQPGAPRQQGQGYDLRPRFVAGKTTRYSLWARRRVRWDLAGALGTRSWEQTIDSEAEVDWQVRDVADDGQATCLMTVLWIAVTVTGTDGQQRTIDTRQPLDDDDPLSRRASAIAGKSIQCHMAADGSVQGVDGVDGVRAVLGDDPIEDEVFVEQAASMATIPAAASGLKLESDWVKSHTWNRHYGTVHEPMRYELGSVECVAGIPLATVSGHAELSVELDEDAEGDGQIEVTSEGQSSTQIIFDLQRGQVAGRNALERVRIEVHHQELDLTRVTEESIQSQALRIAEGEP